MIQDRNIHRDAQALRKTITVALSVPEFGVNQDEPIFHITPCYNWRLSDLACWRQDLSDAVLTITAQACPVGAALGSPRLLPGTAAATFLIDEFWRLAPDGESFINVAPTAAQAFTSGPGVATVLDGFWGVWLLQTNASSDKDVYAQAPIMAFATEEIALANCPKLRDTGNTDGRLAILTVQAVGGDFIAGTTNTDAALVAAFNTAPQVGHVASLPVSSAPRSTQSVLGQQLKDASGTNLLQGKGGPGGDALVLMTKCFGGVSLLNGPAFGAMEYRPWPSGGEGVGDASVSQNRPSFVP